MAKKHVLGKGASLEERSARRRERQKRRARRPIPPKLLDLMRCDPAIDDYLAGVAPTNRTLLQKSLPVANGPRLLIRRRSACAIVYGPESSPREGSELAYTGSQPETK